MAGAVPGGTLIEVANPAVAVSALRRHPRRDTLVVRLWNQTGEAQREKLKTSLPAAGAWLCDLLEDRQEDLALTNAPTTEIEVTLLPHRIVTVEIEFSTNPPGDPA